MGVACEAVRGLQLMAQDRVIDNPEPPPAPSKRDGRDHVTTDAMREEWVIEICELMSNNPTWTLRGILQSQTRYPNAITWGEWLNRRPDWKQRYHLAQEAQADALVQQCVDIADSTDNDWTEDAKGRPKPNQELINRDRLRVDTRKWLAKAKAPHKYGDKVVIENTGNIMITGTDADLMQKKLELLQKLQTRAGILPQIADSSVIEAEFSARSDE